ncbi:MAG TPA: deoxyribonuclease IV [Acidimicrobiales bacterium]
MNIGAHVRGGGKLVPSLEAGVEIGATSVQIFTQSPRMWKPSQYAPEVLANYREAQANHPSITDTFCHATYLINLASPDPVLYQKSVDCLISNLSVGRGMASSGVVLHVGSHLGAGFETVIKQISEAFERALDTADQAPPGVKDCPILIENAAGTGGTVGRSLDEIQALIDACGGDERLGICIDTQHLWASGVDYSTIAGTNALVKDIDDRIGISRLRCFHLNDSKIELGGNRDRHANIDEGTIGTKGLAPLVGHPQIRDLPLLLEVPGSGDGPRAEDVIAARKVVEVGIKLYDGASKSATTPSKGKTSKENATMDIANEGDIQTTKEAASDTASDTIDAVKDFASNEIAAVKKELPKKIAAVKKVAAKEIAVVKKELPKKIAAVKKTATKKIAAVKKSATKKSAAAKKTAAKKKGTVKKSAAKKSAAVKKTAKSAAKKTSAAKKSALKKSSAARKTVAKKTGVAKKSAVKRSSAAKKSAVKKSSSVKKSAAKKSTDVKKSAAKKVAGAKKAVKKNAAGR